MTDRSNWPTRKLTLGEARAEQFPEDLSASTTLEDRFGMVWPITVNAYAFRGQFIERASPFPQFLANLIDAGAKFVIVGSYAVAVHGIPRATKDLDIFFLPTPENATRILQALVQYGVAPNELSLDDLCAPGITAIGSAPARIELLNQLDGVSFETAWENRTQVRVMNRQIPVIGMHELLQNKRAKQQDQEKPDVLWLEWRLKPAL